MQSGDVLAQRIAIEGKDDVKAALKDLGETAKKSFQDAENASEASNSNLLKFSNIIAGIRDTAEKAHHSFEPLVEKFSELRESTTRFGEALSNIGERVFPNFREAITIGAAAGVAGLTEFVVSGAKAAKELGDISSVLGLSVDKFQALRGAASAAGIEANQFTSMMSKFASQVVATANTQLSDFGALAKAVSGDVSTMGVDVLRGTQKTAEGAASIVIRGNRQMGAAAGQSITQLDSRITKSISDGSELGKRIADNAKVLMAVYKAAGVDIHKSLTQVIQDLTNVLAKNDATGKSMRDTFAKIGGTGLIPAATAYEAIDRYTLSWQQNLGRIAGLWKVNDMGLPEIKTLEEAFGDVADKVKVMDKTMALSLIRQNFGRDATKLFDILKKGSEGIKDLGEEFTKLGIGIKPEETEAGSKLVEQMERLETSVSNLRTAFAVGLAPVIGPILEELTRAVGENYSRIRSWAEEISKRAAPGLRELAEYIAHGSEGLQVHEQWVRSVISAWEGFSQAGKFVVTAFGAILSAANGVAATINYIFGTEFSGASILAILAIGKITGTFTLLQASVDLVLGAVGYLATGFASLMTFAAEAGIIRAAVSGIRIAFMAVGSFLYEFFGIASISRLFAPILIAIGPAGWIILAIGVIVAALYYWKGSWKGVLDAMGEGLDWLGEKLHGFWDLIKEVAASFGKLIGVGQDVQSQVAPQAAAGLAGGGWVHGRGGTDTVPIWATAGEFMMRTAAVAKYGIGFMRAVNTLSLPRAGYAMGGSILPPPSYPRFAEGGVIPNFSEAAQQRGSHFTLAIEGREFNNLFAPEDTANSLITFARSKEVTRTGKMPPWKVG